jgi:thymidylate synthase ThyX
MKWDNGQFLYWSVRPIQYKYLETVARKFVIVYNCKENYINIFKELAVAALKPVSEPVHPSVFASFKQYNTKRNQIKNVAIINEKCNQYIWKGKVSSYDTPIVPEVKAIRYSDFKKM